MNDILSSPIPEIVEEILIEANLLEAAIGSNPITEEDQQEQILERLLFFFCFSHLKHVHVLMYSHKITRLDDYISIVQQEGTLEELESLGESIVSSATDIININPSNGVLDQIYEVVEHLETAFVCQSVCGQEPVVVEVFFFFFDNCS